MEHQRDKSLEQRVARQNVFSTLNLIQTRAKDRILPQVLRLDTATDERNRADLLVLASLTIKAMRDTPQSKTFNFAEMRKSSDVSIQPIYEDAMRTLGKALAFDLSF